MKMDRTDKEKLKQALLMLADEDCESNLEMDVSSELTDKVMKDYSKTASVKKRTLVYKWLTSAACFLLVVVLSVRITPILKGRISNDRSLADNNVTNIDFEQEIRNLKASQLPEEIIIPDIELQGVEAGTVDIFNNVYRVKYRTNETDSITYYQMSANDLATILASYSSGKYLRNGDITILLFEGRYYSVAYNDDKYGYVVTCSLCDDSLSEIMLQILLATEQ